MTDHEHNEDCGCDHDHDHDEMVEIVYMAKEDVLNELGISPEEFSQALDVAIDGLEALALREDVADEDIPEMEDLVLKIKDKEYRLGELADIAIEGEFDEDEEFEEEEEELEEEESA